VSNPTLQVERKYFEENRARWVRRYHGRFALVKGRELVGVFNTVEEALGEGARRYGLTPFLVRQVTEEQKRVSIPALALGLLRARP
jgi:hypothetical protein